MSNNYTVIVKGVQEDKDINQVLEKLSALFKSTPDKLRPLLVSGKLVAKKSVDLETAEKYQKAITNAGCVVEIEEELEFEDIPETLIESKQPTDTKYCSSCGHENISSAKYCENCGLLLEIASRLDSKRTTVEILQKQSEQKSEKIRKPKQIEKAAIVKTDDHLMEQMTEQQKMLFVSELNNKSKDTTTAMLLNLLLGGIGAHHFYLERYTIGILYLLFCWTFIPLVISIFDLFFTMKRVGNYNKKLATDSAIKIIATFPLNR